MQGAKVAVWVLVVSLGATALMFGASSLIRASGSGGGGVARTNANTYVVGDIDLESRVVLRRYVRLCKRNQWDNVSDLLSFSQTMMEHLRINEDRVTPVTRAMLGEHLSIMGVILGKSWSEIRADWRGEDLRDLHPPTRKELAETTAFCVRTLTDRAKRWIAVAG